MKQFLLFLLFTISFFTSFAGQVSGTITNEEGNPLPYASVTVKGTSRGVVANGQGKYLIYLSEGSYSIICQHVGFKSIEKSITVSDKPLAVDFTLSVQELKMEEVVIKRGTDPAIEIMKQTIKKRDFYSRQVDSFTADVYIKGLLRSRAIPDKVFGKKIPKDEMEKDGIDSTGKGILFLSESVTKVSFKKPDKIKYEVISSRQSGGGFGISFPFFIDFYSSNVSVFSGTLNPRGFVSPVSDGAFHFYTFRFEGSFFEGDKMIDRIKVTPRRKNEPLFEGYIQIVDGEWRLHSINLTTTKTYGLDLIDTLRITQIHSPVTNAIWRTQNQVVYVAANLFGFDVTGNFLNVYSNYNMNPGFGKKFFDRIFMKYDSTFNKKDSSYWSTTRPVPLEHDEKQNFKFKDSVNKLERDSMYSRRNIDSLRRSREKIKAERFIVGGVRRTFYSPRQFSTYRFDPLVRGLSYNTVEGVSIKLNQSLEVRPRKGKINYTISWNTRYGFSNHHLNSYAALNFNPKGANFRNRFFEVSGGKKLLQFNHDNPIDELTNSVYSLFYKRNYMKVYEAWFGKLEYNNRMENGLEWNVSTTWEDRLPLQNTTDFTFFNKQKTLLPNHPYELGNVPFLSHTALVSSLTLKFQPGQRYIQYPGNKVSMGSKYPTFELNYSKGIPNFLQSKVDFDKWKLSVYDDMNFKMTGLFKYRISFGGFLNAARVEIPDFTHFNGNQTFYNFKYLNSFQLAPYYQYSNIEKLYALAHAEHHFNGLLTNKIPLFNKLKWNLVLGANTFYVNSNNFYAEAFAGIENIFKIFRIDFVTATQAQPGRSFGVRMGLGGILGGSVRMN